MSSLDFFVVGKHVFFYVCKSFAFVAGLVSTQHMLIKHVLASARDDLWIIIYLC